MKPKIKKEIKNYMHEVVAKAIRKIEQNSKIVKTAHASATISSFTLVKHSEVDWNI
jgi:hypothetical protein